MSEIITQVTRRVSPDYHLFGIGDEGGQRPDDVPGTNWYLWSPTFIYVSPVQDVVDVEGIFQLWDGPPDTAGNAAAEADVETAGAFEAPTGRIWLDQLTRGGAGVLVIPAGRYALRITGYNRERTARELDELFDDPDGADFDHLEGQERYLLQFWPTA